MAKEQTLKIVVKDHRDGSEEELWFDNHNDYLQKMKELANTPKVDISEQTASVVHLFPQSQNALDL